MIYQELALVPEMTVAENMFLGHEPRRGGLIDWNAMYRRARELLERGGIDARSDARRSASWASGSSSWSRSPRRSARSAILILDEPTAALDRARSRRRCSTLVQALRKPRASPASTSRTSSTRCSPSPIASRCCATAAASSRCDTARRPRESEVITHMVGREIDGPVSAPRIGTPGERAAARRRAVASPSAAASRPCLQDISFEVRAGEVLGIGGLMGAGRTELLMHLFGVWGERARRHGRARRASLLAGQSPQPLLARAWRSVTEDRKRYGLVLDASHRLQPFAVRASHALSQRDGLIDDAREHHVGQSTVQVRCASRRPTWRRVVGTLSGGNQQKVVLGKALHDQAEGACLLDEPTRGIDVGAKLEVYELDQPH